jgi:CDP-diacylglycerol--serine O-phosphatidyltransferase
MKKAIPSFITCLAVLSGCLSIASSVKYNLTLAGYLILIAALFDFLDGMFARLLGAITAFGKQLDSLADVVNFGVAPAMIMFRLMDDSLRNHPAIDGFAGYVFLYVPFIIVIFAALRLAKFNIDETQTKIFRGLPTPANALFIASTGIYSESQGSLPLQDLSGNTWFLLTVVMVLSVLMVTDISMFSLKFENMNLKNNWARYLLLLSSLVILFLMGTPGITVIIMLYIVLSVAKNLISEKI